VGQAYRRVLGWPQFEEAVWWLHAHTKDNSWQIEQHLREVWQAEIGERTRLSSHDLLEGAVDTAWFGRIYPALGPERWEKIYAAAKYASSGIGHSRARLFADAMAGHLTFEELVSRVRVKRQQDGVRALGLLPLGKSEEIAGRYQITQEFLRTGRKFGAQRRASEALAARKGLDNLARTAGYADPLRLQWAMETQDSADLKGGDPVTVTIADLLLTLTIDSLGEPQLQIRRSGKTLKAIPAVFKKNPDVLALQTRKQHLKQQAARMRISLEEAMCRGDLFLGVELAELLRHPVLAPLFGNLIFISETSVTSSAMLGYPVIDGERKCALRNYAGNFSTILPDTNLRVAHAYDLFQSGEWQLWQHECFAAERIQPFKQIFRELYVLTPHEASGDGGGVISRRYEGHQVQPQKALALFGGRGWLTHPTEGIRRAFYQEGLIAQVEFLNGWFTPAEVEGLTIEGVTFTRKGEWRPLRLADVPPRLFSEVMRDLDLVVSVAHRGGVDPEATASTVEMRATLVKETSSLLSLENVEVQSNYVLIEDKLGSYSVHLGSAVCHRQPGGALCIVPVHSQHQGRIFLPFADSDPKTAEVISKILLLARDSEIKDPTILEQIL